MPISPVFAVEQISGIASSRSRPPVRPSINPFSLKPLSKEGGNTVGTDIKEAVRLTLTRYEKVLAGDKTGWEGRCLMCDYQSTLAQSAICRGCPLEGCTQGKFPYFGAIKDLHFISPGLQQEQWDYICDHWLGPKACQEISQEARVTWLLKERHGELKEQLAEWL